MPNRRPDQYYIDLYDRGTIEELKLKEREERDLLARSEESAARAEIMVRQSISFNSFKNTTILRARSRKEFIERLMHDDDRRDRLIERTPVPKGVKCKTCDALMTVCEHFFDVAQIPLLFVFECPEGHSPRRAIYPDGREYFFPEPKCEKCGFEVKETTKKLKTKIITTYSCSMCGESWIEELEIKIKGKAEAAISEDDRNKYCLTFVGRRTFMEDFEDLAEVI